MLREYKEGRRSESEIVDTLQQQPFEDFGYAKVDYARELRQGFPEVVYAAGKTKEQVLAILQALAKKTSGNLMATRASREMYEFVHAFMPAVQYNEAARLIYLERARRDVNPGKKILVLTAGTSDIPVAEEAKMTAYLWGNDVETCYDCGVSAIYRLFRHIDAIRRANVIIVVAGMEGALASVVGGLTDRPVIAVPTSVGYGASLHGMAALLAMLNSCAAGVSVVNIDNGFGAGVMASRINRDGKTADCSVAERQKEIPENGSVSVKSTENADDASPSEESPACPMKSDRPLYADKSDTEPQSVDVKSGAKDLVILQANIDDMNPQIYGYLTPQLFDAGACDVWTTPVYMKKNRPAVLLSVLVHRRDREACARIIFRETTSIGLRVMPVEERLEAERDIMPVETSYGTVRTKVSRCGGKVVTISAEYDDCSRIAEQTGIPLKEIQRQAVAAAWCRVQG